MSNPLLSASEQAHINAVRANHAAMPENDGNHPTLFRHVADFAVRAELFKHVTNGIGLLAVLFYAVNFSNVMASDNHIYAVYQLFPVFASLAITTTLWTTPANSLLRVLYIVGLYTISWMGV